MVSGVCTGDVLVDGVEFRVYGELTRVDGSPSFNVMVQMGELGDTATPTSVATRAFRHGRR